MADVAGLRQSDCVARLGECHIPSEPRELRSFRLPTKAAIIPPISPRTASVPMARIRLKTKLVLAISGMVFALVAVFSYLYVSHLVRQRTNEAYESAAFVAKQIRESAREASQIDLSSTFVNANDPKQVQAVLDQALQTDPGLTTLLQSIVGYSPTISDAAIADVTGRAIVHTDPSDINTQLEPRDNFANVRNGSFLNQLKVVYGTPKVYDVHLPIQREGQPFGDIRIGISTVFLKSEVEPQLNRALGFSAIAILLALALAAGVSNIASRPLEAIGRRLDQMTAASRRYSRARPAGHGRVWDGQHQDRSTGTADARREGSFQRAERKSRPDHGRLARWPGAVYP